MLKKQTHLKGCSNDKFKLWYEKKKLILILVLFSTIGPLHLENETCFDLELSINGVIVFNFEVTNSFVCLLYNLILQMFNFLIQCPNTNIQKS